MFTNINNVRLSVSVVILYLIFKKKFINYKYFKEKEFMICSKCKQPILTKKPLTANMSKVLKWITTYINENKGISPSFDEIKDGVGFNNKSEVSRYILSLKERGHLTKEDYKPRTIQLL